MLLDAGGPLDKKASSGGTALMFAAAAGYTDVVKLLLERGADVNATVKVIFKFDNGQSDAFNTTGEKADSCNLWNRISQHDGVPQHLKKSWWI